MGFIYSVFLKLLYPTSLAILLLLASALLRKREVARRFCFWLAVAVLLICGNGWVVKYSTRYLERQYPVLLDDRTTGLQDNGTTEGESRKETTGQRDYGTTGQQDHRLRTMDQPSEVGGQLSVVSSLPPVVGGLPIADVILVLGGGTWPKIPPRPTVEVAEAGDRVLYAAYLFRHGKAPKILCTSGVATGGIASRPPAEDMAELLENIGVPPGAILRETKSSNTHEHAANLPALLKEHGFKRVLLVTSALHMPRAMAVFKRSCPGIEFIPAPTDFRVVDLKLPWYREMVSLIPTPSSYVQFSETMHEYLGLAYYWLRGWTKQESTQHTMSEKIHIRIEDSRGSHLT
jgi:uncharacterized SAM-binding protein YcdF (DUF218 family)